MNGPAHERIRTALRQAKQAPPVTNLEEIEELRARRGVLTGPPVLPPGTHAEPVRAGGVPAEWVAVSGAAEDRAVLYLHGSAFITGSAETHREIGARISAASGARVLVLEYRLAPEHPFPAAVHDVLAACRWLATAGIPFANLALAGDSAGGGLALAALVALRGEGDALPACAALISPWAELVGTGDSMRTRAEADPWLTPERLGAAAQLYLSGADPRAPLASPLFADLHGLPPLLIQVGDDEILLDDSVRLAERARAAGVEVELEVWDGMWHVWHQWAAQVPEAQRAIDGLGRFIDRQLRQTRAAGQ